MPPQKSNAQNARGSLLGSLLWWALAVVCFLLGVAAIYFGWVGRGEGGPLNPNFQAALHMRGIAVLIVATFFGSSLLCYFVASAEGGAG